MSKALTWNDLADLYDSQHSSGRQARTLPMDVVFDWAASQKDKFKVSSRGTIHTVNAQ